MNIVFMSMDTLPSTLWARDLYDQMHIRSDFRKWFPRMCQYGFIEGRDYEYMPRVRQQDEGGRTVQRYVKDYRITQDMAKKLCKLHHTAVGAAYRPQPFDWDALLGLLHKKAPRRNSYEEQLSDSDSLVTTTQIAKEYGCGAKVFNRLLHLHGIQYRANGQWVLYSEHHGKGYTSSLTFRLQRSDGSEVEKLHTAWTQKGRKFLYKRFITEDEINGYFTRGSNYSDSRLAIYSFFLNHEDKKERADFLKEHYGIGGSSHALCGADDSHEDHDGRGIALERGSYGNPYASVHLNWNQAAGRIDRLIRDSEYLKPADYSRMPVYERERMAMRVMGFYHHLPNEVERPYPQDLYHEEGRKALAAKLTDLEQAAELLEQMSAQAIAEQLNSENVLAPSEYKRLCGLNYHSGFKAGTHAKWQAIQVLRILKNEVYTGTMVQGRRQKINYKIKKIRDVEESGWIRVPNMHEAIIPQKLFDTVQEVLKLDTCASKGQQTVNLFSGIVRCGGCGQNMVRRTVSKNGKKYIYLHCVTNHNGLGCSSHLISESKLEEVVLAALQGKIQQISGLEHRLDEINEIPKNERRLKSVEEHLKMLEQEEQKYQTLRRQLYEDMSSGIVSKEEYKEFSHSFNEKVETIRKAKAEMNRQRDCLNNLDVEHLPWIEDFKSYQNLTSLNRRVLVELVESITVYDKEHIHIQYRFDQEIRNVLEYCSSVPAAETEESAV